METWGRGVVETWSCGVVETHRCICACPCRCRCRWRCRCVDVHVDAEADVKVDVNEDVDASVCVDVDVNVNTRTSESANASASANVSVSVCECECECVYVCQCLLLDRGEGSMLRRQVATQAASAVTKGKPCQKKKGSARNAKRSSGRCNNKTKEGFFGAGVPALKKTCGSWAAARCHWVLRFSSRCPSSTRGGAKLLIICKRVPASRLQVC